MSYTYIPKPILNYKDHDFKHFLNLEFSNVDNSIVNSLRRVMISELMNVGFHSDDIHIHANTTSLHNQFVTNRINLIPICCYDNKSLNMISYWDTNKAIRKYDFKIQSGIPKFRINVINDKETRKNLLNNRPYDLENETIVNITSQDIQLENHLDHSTSVDKYIKPDYISEKVSKKYNLSDNIYITLNKLKLNSKGVGDQLDLTFEPSIGNGKKHSLYSGVGTVSFKNVQDLSKVDQVFDYKMERVNRERSGKGLKQLTDNEIVSYRKEYDTLDSKRVVKTDEDGNPNVFSLNIETIGGNLPVQLIRDALSHLKWAFKDISNCIFFNNKGYDINASKISVQDSPVIMDSIDIIIQNEKHTTGNIISKYLQKLFTGNAAIIQNVFGFTSYDVKHPLDNFMTVRMFFNSNVSLEKLLDVIKSVESPENDLYHILNNDIEFNDKKLEKILCLFFLKLTCLPIINIISELEYQLDNITSNHKLLENIVNPNNIEYREYEESEMNDIHKALSKDIPPLFKAIQQGDIFKNE